MEFIYFIAAWMVLGFRFVTKARLIMPTFQLLLNRVHTAPRLYPFLTLLPPSMNRSEMPKELGGDTTR